METILESIFKMRMVSFLKQIYDFIRVNNTDIHVIAEINVNWRLVPKTQTTNEMSKG